MNDSIKSNCCTQTNGDDEDNAPPAPEDKNLLKVKVKLSTNQSSAKKTQEM